MSDFQNIQNDLLASQHKTCQTDTTIKLSSTALEKFRALVLRCKSLERLLANKKVEALNLSNVNGALPISFEKADKMLADVNKTITDYNAYLTCMPDQHTVDDFEFSMSNNYLGLKADLDMVGNEIAIGADPIIVHVPANKFMMRSTNIPAINITNIIAKWPAEVRNSPILNLQKEALVQLATYDSIMNAWKSARESLNKKLKFKYMIELKTRGELDAIMKGPPPKKDEPVIPLTKYQLFQLMCDGIGSMVEFKQFLPKNKNFNFPDFAKQLRKNLREHLVLPAMEKLSYIEHLMNKIIFQSNQPRQEEIAVNWIILANAILLDSPADKAGVKRIEDIIYYYHQISEAENEINTLMWRFIRWPASVETIEEFKSGKDKVKDTAILDPLILKLKNLSGFVASCLKESDLEFKAETIAYKIKLDKCINLLDVVPQDDVPMFSRKKTIATIKSRLQNLSMVLSGQIVKTCSLRQIMRGQSCLTDTIILTQDSLIPIKKYVDALYLRLAKFEPKGFMSSFGNKKPNLMHQDLVELLYLHEIRLGGEVQKYSAFILIAVLIAILLYLIVTHLLGEPSEPYKVKAAMPVAPTHQPIENTVNYSRWTDI